MRIEVSVHQINQDSIKERFGALRSRYGASVTLARVGERGGDEMLEVIEEMNSTHAEVDKNRPGASEKTLTANIEISIPHNLLAAMINAIHIDVHQRLETLTMVAPLLGHQIDGLAEDDAELLQGMIRKFNRELDELAEVSSLISQLNKIRLAELPNSIDQEGFSEKDFSDLEALLRGDVFPDN